VLTVGPEDALEQLRDALAMGAKGAVHVVADTDAFGPADVARAVADVVSGRAGSDEAVDLVLLGNDAADTGDFQVGIRLAYRLDWPVVTGVRSFTISAVDGAARVAALGDGPDGVEHFDVPLPAVLTVKEGGITPRYPSLPGRIKAKKAPVETLAPGFEPAGSGRVRLHLPPEQPSQVQLLGEGADAAPALVDVLEQIGVIGR